MPDSTYVTAIGTTIWRPGVRTILVPTLQLKKLTPREKGRASSQLESQVLAVLVWSVAKLTYSLCPSLAWNRARSFPMEIGDTQRLKQENGTGKDWGLGLFVDGLSAGVPADIAHTKISGRCQSSDAHHMGQMEASGRKELMPCMCPIPFIRALTGGRRRWLWLLPLTLRGSVFQPVLSNHWWLPSTASF